MTCQYLKQELETRSHCPCSRWLFPSRGFEEMSLKGMCVPPSHTMFVTKQCLGFYLQGKFHVCDSRARWSISFHPKLGVRTGFEALFVQIACWGGVMSSRYLLLRKVPQHLCKPSNSHRPPELWWEQQGGDATDFLMYFFWQHLTTTEACNLSVGMR